MHVHFKVSHLKGKAHLKQSRKQCKATELGREEDRGGRGTDYGTTDKITPPPLSRSLFQLIASNSRREENTDGGGRRLCNDDISEAHHVSSTTTSSSLFVDNKGLSSSLQSLLSDPTNGIVVDALNTRNEERYLCVTCDRWMPLHSKTSHEQGLQHFKKSRDAITDDTFECDVCDRVMPAYSKESHVRGKQHAKNLRKVLLGDSDMFYCEVCDRKMPGHAKKNHVRGKLHNKIHTMMRRSVMDGGAEKGGCAQKVSESQSLRHAGRSKEERPQAPKRFTRIFWDYDPGDDQGRGGVQVPENFRPELKKIRISKVSPKTTETSLRQAFSKQGIEIDDDCCKHKGRLGWLIDFKNASDALLALKIKTIDGNQIESKLCYPKIGEMNFIKRLRTMFLGDNERGLAESLRLYIEYEKWRPTDREEERTKRAPMKTRTDDRGSFLVTTFFKRLQKKGERLDTTKKIHLDLMNFGWSHRHQKPRAVLITTMKNSNKDYAYTMNKLRDLGVETVLLTPRPMESGRLKRGYVYDKFLVGAFSKVFAWEDVVECIEKGSDLPCDLQSKICRGTGKGTQVAEIAGGGVKKVTGGPPNGTRVAGGAKVAEAAGGDVKVPSDPPRGTGGAKVAEAAGGDVKVAEAAGGDVKVPSDPPRGTGGAKVADKPKRRRISFQDGGCLRFGTVTKSETDDCGIETISVELQHKAKKEKEALERAPLRAAEDQLKDFGLMLWKPYNLDFMTHKDYETNEVTVKNDDELLKDSESAAVEAKHNIERALDQKSRMIKPDDVSIGPGSITPSMHRTKLPHEIGFFWDAENIPIGRRWGACQKIRNILLKNDILGVLYDECRIVKRNYYLVRNVTVNPELVRSAISDIKDMGWTVIDTSSGSHSEVSDKHMIVDILDFVWHSLTHGVVPVVVLASADNDFAHLVGILNRLFDIRVVLISERKRDYDFNVSRIMQQNASAVFEIKRGDDNVEFERRFEGKHVRRHVTYGNGRVPMNPALKNLADNVESLKASQASMSNALVKTERRLQESMSNALARTERRLQAFQASMSNALASTERQLMKIETRLQSVDFSNSKGKAAPAVPATAKRVAVVAKAKAAIPREGEGGKPFEVATHHLLLVGSFEGGYFAIESYLGLGDNDGYTIRQFIDRGRNGMCCTRFTVPHDPAEESDAIAGRCNDYGKMQETAAIMMRSTEWWSGAFERLVGEDKKIAWECLFMHPAVSLDEAASNANVIVEITSRRVNDVLDDFPFDDDDDDNIDGDTDSEDVSEEDEEDDGSDSEESA
eukprot:g1960.t1